MNEQVITYIMLITIGGFFLLRNIIHLRDEKKLREYLENSGKGRLWVSKFGLEKTEHLCKKYFLPAGITVALLISGSGVLLLAIHFYNKYHL